MDLGIKGRRALIFGGSRGIGRAVAGALAAEGAEVAVCARKEWAAKKVASEATEKSGVRAKGYKIDAWDGQTTLLLIRRIVDDFGTVDILFGVARRSVLEDRNELSPSGWQREFDKGFLRFKAVTETLLPGMQDRQWGRILWMLPMRTPGTSLEGQLHAVMTSALSGWIESMATDLSTDGVSINLLTPSFVSRTVESAASPNRRRTRPELVPTPRPNPPSVTQVAAYSTFLLGNPAGAICGRTIALGMGDGGSM